MSLPNPTYPLFPEWSMKVKAHLRPEKSESYKYYLAVRREEGRGRRGDKMSRRST